MGSAVLARARKSLRSFHAPARENSGCAQACETLAFEGWKAIVERRQLIAPCGSEIPLTGGEFKLLSAFLKNPGRVLSRQQLMDVTHGTGWHAYERTVDAQISRLRKKLEADPKKPKLQCTATVTCLPRVCRGKARRKTDDRFPDFTVRVSARQRLREFLSSRCSHVSWRA